MNPVRRRTNFRIDGGYLRTISPIKAIRKSTTPEKIESQ